ncbi:HlyD family efflux transporter periplasmic adaptor subunit [Nostoc sp. CENA67]|uniref:HlyD family efflux transporter periplasmic adaptor subunit n=1 Tax=Amazonocrinis nigriterrae CENA67 TaxID=2794033 RepID=A0A8J7LCD4_9NOST|nr:HlyD family efflux transporter periplasmic adaptor subunit [Amazonocrinis nigriterrae]MBH8566665.1 HlyD family efflux transporter periplasmic adaptor subunit [Amazonocrinis nigriterrae CENA67]
MSGADLPSISNPKPQGVTHPDSLHLATPNEFLPPISYWTTMGGVVLLGIFGTAISLAGILKYKVTIQAPATIRPAGELRLVQSPIEGTIKSIAVQVNQAVKQGQVIAVIDDNRLQTQKSQLQTNIQQATLQLSQLDAQIRALDEQIAAEKYRLKRAVASIQAEVNRNQRDFRDRQITSVAQVKEAEANLQQAQKELQKSQAQLKSAQASLKSSEASLKAAKAKRGRYQPLVQTGSISQDQFQEVQLAVEQQQQLLESQKATVEERTQAVQQQQQAVAAATAKLQGTYPVLNPSDADVTISQEKIATETATGRASLGRLYQEREQLIQQKLEIQKQTSRDRKELLQTSRDIASTVIRAPASGIIQELNLRNALQVLRSGDAIAQISPTDSPLIIKALVESQDIRKVENGQEVQLRVYGCSYTDFGTLQGQVKAISPDVITSSDKDKNTAVYEVTIQPEKLILTAKNRNCAIQSGMEARADIISEQETVLNFILRKARILSNL